MGQLKRRHRTWWIRYYRDGKRYEESSRSTREGDARKLLRLREGDVERGVPVTPKVARLRFEDAAADVVNDYRTNRKRSTDDVERRIQKHLLPFFAGRRLASISAAEIRSYIAARQQQRTVTSRAFAFVTRAGTTCHMPAQQREVAGVSNAEINRELTTLKRMFNLAIQSGKLLHKPHVPMLKENNVRTGFFEQHEFDAVLRRLPTVVQSIARFAYITGWRVDSEVLPLLWRHVDFAAREVRLDPGTTKNGDGRTFPMTRELRSLLEEQRVATDRLQRHADQVCPHVFHRNGRPVRTFRVVFARACREAGCPGRLVHDLRRTAVRNLVRAGIPERVAMQMTGHKTRSVFERYNIVSAGDLRDAAKRLDALAGTAGEAGFSVMGTISGTIGPESPSEPEASNSQLPA